LLDNYNPVVQKGVLLLQASKQKGSGVFWIFDKF
jgi:hypothetical protein